MPAGLRGVRKLGGDVSLGGRAAHYSQCPPRPVHMQPGRHTHTKIDAGNHPPAHMQPVTSPADMQPITSPSPHPLIMQPRSLTYSFSPDNYSCIVCLFPLQKLPHYQGPTSASCACHHHLEEVISSLMLVQAMWAVRPLDARLMMREEGSIRRGWQQPSCCSLPTQSGPCEMFFLISAEQRSD